MVDDGPIPECTLLRDELADSGEDKLAMEPYAKIVAGVVPIRNVDR